MGPRDGPTGWTHGMIQGVGWDVGDRWPTGWAHGMGPRDSRRDGPTGWAHGIEILDIVTWSWSETNLLLYFFLGFWAMGWVHAVPSGDFGCENC